MLSIVMAVTFCRFSAWRAPPLEKRHAAGGKETQGWRDSSHTAMVGAGKFGSAKLSMATARYPIKPSLSLKRGTPLSRQAAPN